jgi:hypothetical protein
MNNTIGRSVLLFILFSWCLSALCPAQRRPASLSFWTVGGGEGVRARFGKGLYPVLNRPNENKIQLDRLLLTLAEAPLNEVQIRTQSGLPADKITASLSELASVRLVRQDNNGRWMTTIPVITDRQMLKIRNDLLPVARKVARYLHQQADQARKLYNHVKAPTDPTWEEAAHLILDKFLIDGTFHHSINTIGKEHDIQKHYSQDQKKLPAFFLERGEHFSTFGTNWYDFTREDIRREVYVLHGGVLNRLTIPMNRYRGNRDFAAMIARITPDGSIHALTDKDQAILKDLEWIDGGRLLVPVIQAKTIRSLNPWLKQEGKAAAHVFFKEHVLIMDSYRDSCYATFSDAAGDYIQVCYHVLFGLIIEQLVERGVLPSIPTPLPEHFGVYLQFGER